MHCKSQNAQYVCDWMGWVGKWNGQRNWALQGKEKHLGKGYGRGLSPRRKQLTREGQSREKKKRVPR